MADCAHLNQIRITSTDTHVCEECVKLGDDSAATLHFQKLLEMNPSYVAGYFQFGQLLARIGRLDEARKLLSDGIVVAQRAGDMHARDEMQAALTLLR